MEEKVIELFRATFAGLPAPKGGSDKGLDIYVDGNLFLISAEAMRYYFPSMVERSLQAKDFELLDSILLLLRTVDEPHSTYQISLFDKSQRAAVRMLLHFLRDHPEQLKSQESIVLVERAIPLWGKMN